MANGKRSSKKNQKRKNWGERKTQKAINRKSNSVNKKILQNFEDRVDKLEKENSQIFQKYELRNPRFYQRNPYVNQGSGDNKTSVAVSTWREVEWFSDPLYITTNPATSTTGPDIRGGYACFELKTPEVLIPNYNIQLLTNTGVNVSGLPLKNLVDSQKAYLTKLSFKYKTHLFGLIRYYDPLDIIADPEGKLAIWQNKYDYYLKPVKIRRFIIKTPNNYTDEALSNIFRQLPHYNQSFASANRRNLQRLQDGVVPLKYQVIGDRKMQLKWRTLNSSIREDDVAGPTTSTTRWKEYEIKYINIMEDINVKLKQGGQLIKFGGPNQYFYDIETDPDTGEVTLGAHNYEMDDGRYYIAYTFEDGQAQGEFCRLLEGPLDFTTDYQHGGFSETVYQVVKGHIKVAT